MKIKLYIALVVSVIYSCRKGQCDFKNSYSVLNVGKYKDCEVYAMILEPGSDYLFRYSLSGSCKNINLNDLIHSYDAILKEKSLKQEPLKDKKIIIELYDYTDFLQDSLVQRTEKYFNVKAIVSNKWNEVLKSR